MERSEASDQAHERILTGIRMVSIMAALLRQAQWRSKRRGTAYADEQMSGEFSGFMPNTPVLLAMGIGGVLGVPLILIATWSWILFSLPTRS